MIKQNTSHAVMSQRNPNMDTFDNFPTPPWATRAFVESQLLGANDLATSTCLEPACGQGYMSETLKEYFGQSQVLISSPLATMIAIEPYHSLDLFASAVLFL